MKDLTQMEDFIHIPEMRLETKRRYLSDSGNWPGWWWQAIPPTGGARERTIFLIRQELEKMR